MIRVMMPTGHAPLHIQTGDGKGHIILLSGHPVVVAGVGYRIDAIGEPDIDHAFMNIGDLSGVLALDAALLQVVPVSVFRSALDVGPGCPGPPGCCAVH